MLFAVTFAAAITPPVGSVTVPRMDPRKLCAHAGAVSSNSAAAPIIRVEIASVWGVVLRLCMIASLGEILFVLVFQTLVSGLCFPTQFFLRRINTAAPDLLRTSLRNWPG